MGKGLFKKIPTNIYHHLVGKAVQWLRVLVDLAEDLGSVTSTYIVVYSHL